MGERYARSARRNWKAHDNEDAPVIDDKHYAIAVYGVPGRFLSGDEKKMEGELKKEVTLRRDGKKDIKPSGVTIIDKPDGQVVVYEFSTSNEITRDDHRVEFNAKMGRLQLTRLFFRTIWSCRVSANSGPHRNNDSQQHIISRSAGEAG